MTYNYYIKQPMPMCEIKLNQLLHKNPELINCLNIFITYQFTAKYTQIDNYIYLLLVYFFQQF